MSQAPLVLLDNYHKQPAGDWRFLQHVGIGRENGVGRRMFLQPIQPLKRAGDAQRNEQTQSHGGSHKHDAAQHNANAPQNLGAQTELAAPATTLP